MGDDADEVEVVEQDDAEGSADLGSLVYEADEVLDHVLAIFGVAQLDDLDDAESLLEVSRRRKRKEISFGPKMKQEYHAWLANQRILAAKRLDVALDALASPTQLT